MRIKDIENTNTGLTVENVTKIYKTKKGDILALDNVSLHVQSNEFLALLGTSGCGKSTLLRIICGLEKTTEGSIINQRKVIAGPGADRGMVFQAYNLFPWMTISENIQFGLKQKNASRKQAREIAEHYAELVGLKGFENQYPNSLSGGMRQRVAIARALANDPSVLLLDEPFGALDMQTRGVMQELLLDIWQKSPKTIIMVTHDIDEAIFLADRVAIMSARPGRIKEILDIKEGISRPRNYHIKTSQEFIAYKERATDIIREESMKLLK
ncbi:ABC transporter ATP-binding protein [Pectinatus haikarae]|uniref:ABC-type nitrate/sulfonate/bicarbonate transport system ATPase subunit n=2 Tax=Pectinatus haikarae TaxID=349096 RepID=A0ABT9Y6I1_9FIRM|nr:ABC transporter ATP-binding protein [Pectinatus haikarae]MDQ0203422.1 ABC-type nitrate/sulfonate/bicarbonate transport system ATPase subunit [Pectinatus haikarae]